MSKDEVAKLEDIRSFTAFWLGVDEAEVSYIDEDFLADLDAEDDVPGEEELIGTALISSLYYNRPAVAVVNGVQYVYYYRDCSSSPRRRIRRDSIYRTIPAGSCGAFLRYKMFYS
jgi:hypothetical protein